MTDEHKLRITGQIEEWWKKVYIEHNCILVDKPKAESEEV